MLRWADTLAAKGGGWGYGFAPHTAIHSAVVLGLIEVKRAGLDAPQLNGAVAALKALRGTRGLYPYAQGGAVPADTPRESLGRSPIAEWALFRAGSTTKEEISSSLGVYLDGWSSAWDEGGKALRGEPLPDYFLFSRWYALQAAREAGRLDDERVVALREGLLSHQAADGSWMDSPLWTGHVAGTALGVLSLAATRR